MTERKGMGRVHDGFYGALFHEDQDGGTLFCDLVAAIRAADDGRRKGLYLTGPQTLRPLLQFSEAAEVQRV